MVGAMADRYFPNTMRDYAVSLDDAHADKRSREAPDQLLPAPDVLLKVARALKDEVGRSSFSILLHLIYFSLVMRMGFVLE